MKKLITILIVGGVLLTFNQVNAQDTLTPNRIEHIINIMRDLGVGEGKISQIRVILNQDNQPVIQMPVQTPQKPIKTFKERQLENYQKNGLNVSA